MGLHRLDGELVDQLVGRGVAELVQVSEEGEGEGEVGGAGGAQHPFADGEDVGRLELVVGAVEHVGHLALGDILEGADQAQVLLADDRRRHLRGGARRLIVEEADTGSR